jgi:hypothetical protein
MTIDDKFAKLREIYPDDVERIQGEEKRVSELLKQQEYFEDPRTKELIELCRKDIVDARIKLASNRALNQEQRDELWQLIESREWFVRMVAKDYRGELEQIGRELEVELSR